MDGGNAVRKFRHLAIGNRFHCFPGFVHVFEFEEILADCYYLCHVGEAYQLL